MARGPGKRRMQGGVHSSAHNVSGCYVVANRHCPVSLRAQSALRSHCDDDLRLVSKKEGNWRSCLEATQCFPVVVQRCSGVGSQSGSRLVGTPIAAAAAVGCVPPEGGAGIDAVASTLVITNSRAACLRFRRAGRRNTRSAARCRQRSRNSSVHRRGSRGSHHQRRCPHLPRRSS